MLVVSAVSVFYGPVPAIRRSSLSIGAGEAVALIGMNGAGKSTLGKVIAGRVKPSEGSVMIELSEQETNLDSLDTAERVRNGIIYVPEDGSVFPGLSVLENLEIIFATFNTPRKEQSAAIEQILPILPLIRHRGKQSAGSLSGGEKKLLAIARAMLLLLVTRSKGGLDDFRFPLLIVDEPSHGLHASSLRIVASKLHEINKRGISLLLIDELASFAFSVARRTYIMRHGSIVETDLSTNLRSRSDLPEIYFDNALGTLRSS